MILSIILGAIILALSYYEAYIYADIIISVSEYIIPMNIIMTVYQIISNAIGVLLILIILYLMSGLLYLSIKGFK
jgi:hypothetical protein